MAIIAFVIPPDNPKDKLITPPIIKGNHPHKNFIKIPKKKYSNTKVISIAITEIISIDYMPKIFCFAALNSSSEIIPLSFKSANFSSLA